MKFEQKSMVLSDGRTLEYGVAGNPEGSTVLIHHGTPGSYMTFQAYIAEDFLEGHFLVSYSRAGYGSSTPRSGRRVADVVTDVREVLDHEDRSSYVTIGWSGGGPHALACAALDAPRCRGAWSIAGVAPVDAGFDWTEGMGPENIEEFALARQGGPAFEEAIAAAGVAMGAATADTLHEIFGGLLSEPDKMAWGPADIKELEAADLRHAFVNGAQGLHDDDQAFLASWGFDVEEISVPVTFWFGDLDNMVPPTHGWWLAKAIPGAVAEHRAPEGHISLWFTHGNEIWGQVANLASAQ